MVPRNKDDWSDSDEDDALPEVETTVLLGIPDGPIGTPGDLADVAVSRIGGRPAFLPSIEPSIASSHCESCSKAMELLVQLWCPFEDSPVDRALYVWGCGKATCNRRDGSVRAWRGLRFNKEYAVKLQKKLARAKALERAVAAAEGRASEQRSVAKVNPFALNSPAAPSPSVPGFQIFGGLSRVPKASPQGGCQVSVDTESELESDPIDFKEDSSFIVALASTTLTESAWLSAPSFPPLYLSTTSEYIPPPQKPKIPPGVRVEDPVEDKRNVQSDWGVFEVYENSLEVDKVFERFAKRVGYEGQQCVRYELKGTPLPFASDKVFDMLFPMPATRAPPVTKPGFDVITPAKRTYATSTIPPCPVCKSPRTFECQLMPNLINVLSSRATAAERPPSMVQDREDVVEESEKAKAGMEWGTCMIFSCEKDCCEGDECWREEFVLVQWDD